MELKVHITNFGPFKERQTYTFSNITIHYGPTGSGKSILDHAIRLFTGNPTTMNEFHHFEMSDIMDFDALLYKKEEPFVLEIELIVCGHALNRKYFFKADSNHDGLGLLVNYEMHWNGRLIFGFNNEHVHYNPRLLNYFYKDLIEVREDKNFRQKVDSWYSNELADGFMLVEDLNYSLIDRVFEKGLDYSFEKPRIKAVSNGWEDNYAEYMQTFECVFYDYENDISFCKEFAESLRDLYEAPFSFFQGHYSQFDPFKSRDYFSGTIVKTSSGYSYRPRLKGGLLEFFVVTSVQLGLAPIIEMKIKDPYFQKIGYAYYAINKGGKSIHYSMLGEGEKRLYDLVFHLAFIHVEHFHGKNRTDPYFYIIDNIDLISTGRGNAEILDKLSSVFPNIIFVCATKSREFVNEMLSLCEEKKYKSSALSISSFKKNKVNFTASITNHEISETFTVFPGL